MIFEHREIEGTGFKLLIPRENLDNDLVCKAINIDIREKYFVFLSKPFKKMSSDFVFFEGHATYIICDKGNEEIYFFDKFSSEINEEFDDLFRYCEFITEIVDYILSFNLENLKKRNYKGEGKLKEYKNYFIKERDKYFFNTAIMDTIQEFFDFIYDNIGNSFMDAQKIDDGNDIRETIQKKYVYEMSGRVNDFKSKYIFQKEKLSEFLEALNDWKLFYLNIEEDFSYKNRTHLYLDTLENLIRIRKIDELNLRKYSKKVIYSTLDYLIFDVSVILGVENGTALNALKKTFNVKSKKELYEILIDKHNL